MKISAVAVFSRRAKSRSSLTRINQFWNGEIVKAGPDKTESEDKVLVRLRILTRTITNE